ncbi:hypothetical protein PVT01_000030800 [Plasmodium vivax]|uniref:VIR protein n=1 Tax=Plasmodium vivax TaxID=5855 RepID=A0A1G4E3K1_PLAVI|nr:hypothetical protein PVT01_000030800 [Plasmodium vivax]
MAKNSIDNLVLNYDDYSTITNKFDEKRDYKYSYNYDVVLDYAKGEEWKREKYNTTYDAIYRYLSNSGVMWYYMEQGCKYISYLLHKRVKDEHNQYYNLDTFKILHKYVEYYYKHKYSIRDNKCLPHIVYVNYDMYKELNTIYELYNKYNKLLPMNSQWDDKKCLSLKSFINQYNYYIKKIDPTNIELKKILKPFENHVKKTINGLDGKCTKFGSHTTNSGIEQGADRGLGSGRGPEPVIKEVTVSELQESHDYITPRTHTRNERIGQSQYRLRVESAEPLELTDDRSFLPQHGLEGDQETMGKITGAITGVLREVEPGPILGVSGGMGALFLLFKYTPVGTFFRGGRGRANRIPRSFNGQFLGGFPGYEDYDVGHIGYGPMNPLAE